MFGGLFLPPNNFHNRSSLEYALDTLNVEVFGQPMHRTIAEEAAFLGYTIIKGHVFNDGNKRTALSAIRVFLLLNGLDLNIETESVDEGALNFCVEFADSLRTREELVDWIDERLI
jgi:death-on-curing protein